MDREQLYKSLTELENQLKRVKSANEQVEKVIASDRQLVSGIQDYIAKADELLKSVKAAYDGAVIKVGEQAMKGVWETSTSLLKDYKSDVSTAHTEYNAAMKESLDSFKSVVSSEKRVLQEKVAALSALVDDNLIPLRDSLTTIVDGKLSRVPSDFNRIMSESKTILESSVTALKNASKTVSDDCKKMAEKVELLPAKVEELSTALKEALSENKDMILSKLSELDSNAFAEKMSPVLEELSKHVDERMDGMENAFESSISQAERSLSSKVDGIDGKYTEMKEMMEKMNKSVNLTKVLSILLVIIAIIAGLFLKRFV